MWAVGVPLDTVLKPSHLADVQPILSAYSYLVQCKNLGLTVNANELEPDSVRNLHTVHIAVEDVREKQRARRAGRG